VLDTAQALTHSGHVATGITQTKTQSDFI